MNTIFSRIRIFRALSTLVLVVLLAGCGSGKTVDPLVPTRVIGLGDTFNDTNTATGGSAHTARAKGADASSSVVGYLASLFGVPMSSVVSYASSVTPLITDLAAQVDRLDTLSASSDLVVITVGTQDIINGKRAEDVVPELINQINRLLAKGATHILVMPPLDLTKTPVPPANAANAMTFINAESALLQKAFSGRYATNVVIYGNTPLSVAFSLATASRTYPYTDSYGTLNNTYQSICGAAFGAAGCDRDDDGDYLFADNYNLTPKGQQWVAQNLYVATANGWR